MIERALGIEGWMSPAELKWLGEQAARHRRIAEVGSWRGRSTAAIADSTTGTVYAVDTWMGSPETDNDPDFAAKGSEWLYSEFRQNAADNVIPERMSSLEAARALSDLRFDMIFIDGAHDYASVRADIEAWRPLLAPGGLLCGHDYWPDSDVRRAVDDCLTAVNVVGTSIWQEKPVLSPTAILVPSLNRPGNIRRTVESIESSTPEPHTLLFCVSDHESMDILDELGVWYIDDSDGNDRRYVTRMNRLISYIDDAKTLFFGSDDVIHHPGWLTEALKVMATGPSCVVVNDQRNAMGTQAVIRREYLERAVYDAPGLAFHPGYLHNFADNEMFWTASVQHELATAVDAVVEHLHPLFNAPNSDRWDETYRNAMNGWGADEARWRERHDAIKAAIPTKLRPVRTYW